MVLVEQSADALVRRGHRRAAAEKERASSAASGLVVQWFVVDVEHESSIFGSCAGVEPETTTYVIGKCVTLSVQSPPRGIAGFFAAHAATLVGKVSILGYLGLACEAKSQNPL